MEEKNTFRDRASVDGVLELKCSPVSLVGAVAVSLGKGVVAIPLASSSTRICFTSLSLSSFSFIWFCVPFFFSLYHFMDDFEYIYIFFFYFKRKIKESWVEVYLKMLTLLAQFIFQLSTHFVRLDLHLCRVLLFDSLFVNHTLVQGQIAIAQLQFINIR